MELFVVGLNILENYKLDGFIFYLGRFIFRFHTRVSFKFDFHYNSTCTCSMYYSGYRMHAYYQCWSHPHTHKRIMIKYMFVKDSGFANKISNVFFFGYTYEYPFIQI